MILVTKTVGFRPRFAGDRMASVGPGVDKLIKPFSGGEGVNEWITKVELVARLTGVKDEAAFLPLFLEGGALAVYLEMPSAEQKDAATIKKSCVQPSLIAHLWHTGRCEG